MHHQEPLGLSGRIFIQYWKERGEDVTFSYLTHREKMEAMWRESVEGWKKYPDIIWTIGLRGAGDKAVWATEHEEPDLGRIVFHDFEV